jgi:hypothetical protein
MRESKPVNFLPETKRPKAGGSGGAAVASGELGMRGEETKRLRD